MIKATIIVGRDIVEEYEYTNNIDDTLGEVVSKVFADKWELGCYLDGLRDGVGYEGYSLVEQVETELESCADVRFDCERCETRGFKNGSCEEGGR